MSFCYIGLMIHLWSFSGLFQRDCSVPITRSDDYNDPVINIDQIEEQDMENGSEVNLECQDSYSEATTASSASNNESLLCNDNLRQKKSKSRKNTSQPQIVL